MKFLLTNLRHYHRDINSLPIIFDEVSSEQVFDFDWHKKVIHEKLKGKTSVIVYVTGLTPLVVSVINYCALFEINLVLYHFNTDTKKYVAQSIM